MTVRVFSSARITLDEGTLDTFRTNGFLNGPWTAVCVFKRSGSTSDGTQFIFSASSSGSLRFGLSYSSASALQVTVGGLSRTFGASFTIANNTWYVFAVRLAADGATPQAKLWNAQTGAVVADWTNGSGTLDFDTNLWDQIQIGNRVNDFPLNGKSGGIALFSSALDNTTGDTLGAGLQEWLDASPVGMWPLTQASTSDPVLDLVGDADQTALTGTSVDAGDDPASFDLSLGGGATDLTVADAQHAQSAESPTLTQVHVLTVADASHAHTADAPALTQVHVLAAEDAAHDQTAEASTLTQVHQLVAADAAHAHTTDSPTLVQVHQLVVADAVHAHTAEEPTLTSGLSLDPHSASHAHTAGTPALTQAHVLAVDGAAHAHLAGQVALTQVHVLVVAGAVHAHHADQVTFGDDVIHRPDTGTVARPNTGIVARPDTGTIVRP